MKKALFTANYNGILHDNVRESFMHAANRWGAEYVEMTQENHPIRLHPATVKMEAFDLTDAGAVFIIDADAIISAECPNPFESLPAGEFSAVGLSRRIDPDGHLQWLGVQHEWRDKLLILPGVEFIDPGDWRYFNSGVMLAWRDQHEAAFRVAFEVCHIPNQMSWIEQTPLQYALKKLGCAVHYADDRWNFIHPMMIGGDWTRMRSTGVWVYHGAGDPSRMNWLGRVDWR